MWQEVAQGGLDQRPPLAAPLTRLLRPIDRFYLWVYGSKLNPLYQSGTVALLCLTVALVTGLYLLIFYRVGAPYESVQGLQNQVLLGRWIRALHRYSSDIALVAILAHAVKMLMSGRTWGTRALAWISGLVLTATVIFVGLTGLVMVWDTQAQLLAVEGVRTLDLLPILSEPLGRLFSDNDTVPGSFFFMVMFLHVAAPLGGAFLFWLHVSRVARPVFFPPAALTRLLLGAMLALSVAMPVAQLPAADLRALPARVYVDLFYGFWLPLVTALGPLPAVLTLGALSLALASVPLWWKPRARPAPSVVDERLCTGCTTCFQDCPYQAISMVARSEPSRLSELVARVNPDVCVSCGICAGSCAPMGVGPALRTGRDQLREIEALQAGADQVVVLACRYGPGDITGLGSLEGVVVHPIGCGGSLHTSVVEHLVRHGAGGVMVLTCPERDCSHREGPKWLEQRFYHEREAELQARVDRRRVRLAGFSAAQERQIVQAVEQFRDEVRALEGPSEQMVVTELECPGAVHGAS
ncbi:hydrogenase iron-sulfur subunit [bacterium CPR1]|nr:hydrogenase iron-sulfur subunit [bacterium CPR1]